MKSRGSAVQQVVPATVSGLHQWPRPAQKTPQESLLRRGHTVSMLTAQMLGQDRAARLTLLLETTQKPWKHQVRKDRNNHLESLQPPGPPPQAFRL